MNLDDRLAVMRRENTPVGEAEPFVHLLAGRIPPDEQVSLAGPWRGYACDPDSSTDLHPPMYCRTTDPAVATCPACVAAAPTFTS